MSNRKSSSKSHASIADLILGIASVGAGAYHGYCDAKNIPLTQENLEWNLTYVPTIVQGVIGAVNFGLVGLMGGGIIGGVKGNKLSTKLLGAGGGAIAGTALGAGVGGVFGGGIGALQTLIGYGAGYLTGKIIR